ncbi:histidinol-phosphate transaminase [Malassezia vespertilionis]|uniref:histidinol-phosphate transaminase n=1 Tax=Malassezia vespertilionis TaxID=2020962 RepID=A0A2N1JH79_9BASI|nr:histidinol-phosphate transaminase [Malassezia vespertilionis]PKI85911.1 His5p [Malassezia vespertilionis]WFD04864.1 histidinol-phosphate transaminase [Malassezia vespertilionis]
MTIQGFNVAAWDLAKAHKPEHFVLDRVVRPNILSLKPYRCARDDYQEGVLLDANENALGPSLGEQRINSFLDLHRYPDPGLFGTRAAVTALRHLPDPAYTFLGVGSDEVIDLLQRCFARPGKEKILICPPTYGMYSVCAAVNDLDIVQIPLLTQEGKFALDTPAVLAALEADPSIRLVFICSPGNPTGTLISLEDVRAVLDCAAFEGLVVVDEAYIDFALAEQTQGKKHGNEPISAIELVPEYENLVVSQTLSKSFGLAGIRMGLAFSQPRVIQVMNNTKAPYSISTPTAFYASQALSESGLSMMRTNVDTLVANRNALLQALATIPALGAVLGANDANFVLVPVLDAPHGKPDSQRAAQVYKNMAEHSGVVVRDRSKELGCAGCLRISVGTAEENEQCIALLRAQLA